MAQAALRHILFGLATAGLLAGCVQGTGTGGGADGSGTVAAPGTKGRAGAARDIEAPDVFQVTESALWDGRPSLGGIWVASPDAVDPERVVMFNPATGKSVQGALFRRERDNPGPRLQISSDAAEALGILAGQPVELKVTALRREEPEAEAEAPVAAEPGTDTAEGVDTAAAEAALADDAAKADGGADAAETAAAATAALAAAGATAADGVTADPAAADAAAVVAEPPKRKTWKERRAEAKAAREAKKAAAAAAAAGEAVPETAEVAATPDAVAVTTIETAPLDAGATEAAADPVAEAVPVAEPPKTRRQKRAEEEAAKAAAEAAAATAVPTEEAATETASGTGRPIQIASFSKEENADRAVQALAKINVGAQTQKSEAAGKIVWGVVAFGDDALLASIKAAGFADAYFLK